MNKEEVKLEVIMVLAEEPLKNIPGVVCQLLSIKAPTLDNEGHFTVFAVVKKGDVPEPKHLYTSFIAADFSFEQIVYMVKKGDLRHGGVSLLKAQLYHQRHQILGCKTYTPEQENELLEELDLRDKEVENEQLPGIQF